MTKVEKVKSTLNNMSAREKSSIFNYLLKDEAVGWAPGVKQAWMAEAEEVDRLVRAGKMKTYSAEEVFASLRRRR